MTKAILRHFRLGSLGFLGSSAALLLSAPAIRAQDQSVPLTFGISQSFQALNNADFSDPSSGNTATSITSLSFGSSTVTPTDSLRFSAGVGIALQRDADGNVTTSVNAPNVALNYGRTTSASAVTAYASYSLDQLDQLRSPLDFVNDNGQIILPSNPADLVSTGLKQDIQAGASLEIGRDKLFGLTFAVTGEQISYTETTDPALLDIDTASASVTGRFSYSPQGDLTLGLGTEHQLTLDKPQNIQRNTQDLSLGTSYDVSPVLTLGGYVKYEIVDATGFAQSSRPRAQVSADYTFLNGSLSLQVGDQDSSLVWQQKLLSGGFSASLSHGQDNSGNGTLDQLGFNYSQTINDLSGLNMGLFYSSDNGSTTSADLAATTLVVSYNHQLTKDWGMNVGANYRLRDPSSNSTDPAASAGVFLTVSRNVNFLR